METPMTQNMRGIPMSEVERMRKQIRKYEEEKRQSEAKLQRQLEEVREETELQVRRKMVAELQERQVSGEMENGQVMTMIEGIKRNYEVILKGMEDGKKAKEEELEDMEIRLKQQIADLEEENHRLSLKLTAITGTTRRWCE